MGPPRQPGEQPSCNDLYRGWKIAYDRVYEYALVGDSLTIYAISLDHPGDGNDRGSISELTDSSLTIMWSTGDMNRYVRVKDPVIDRSID